MFISLFVLATCSFSAEGGTTIPVLSYHYVVPRDTIKEPNNNAIVAAEDFAEQMAYLKEQGYQTLFLSELVTMLRTGEELPEKAVVITFDDGYENNYQYAYPILREHGLKASIFVVVNYSLPKPQDLDPEHVISWSPHLSLEQMREMIASGCIEIQSHSYDGHGNVTMNASGKQGPYLVSRRYLREEGRMETAAEYKERISRDISRAREVLESELNVPVTVFAYPYGRSNKKLLAALQDAGYEGAVLIRSGYVNAKTGVYTIPRLVVRQNMTVEEFAKLLHE